MAKTIDYIALSIILAIITFVWGIMIFNSIWISLIVAIAFSLAIVFSIRYFKGNKYRFSPSKLTTHFAIKGNDYVINLLRTTLKNVEIENTSNYIMLKTCMIFSCFKFGAASAQDILNVAKVAQEKQIRTVFVMANGIDKKAYQVANLMEIKLKPIKIGAIYRYLDKHSALPDLKNKRTKPSFKLIFETVFSRGNFKAYVFSGAILLLTSFFTPMKIYYIVMGSIMLSLAILSLTFGSGELFYKNAFKQLESAVQNDCADSDDIDDSNSSSSENFDKRN